MVSRRALIAAVLSVIVISFLGPVPAASAAATELPATLRCSDITTDAGTAVVGAVTATDPDDTVTDLAVTAVNPAPAAGSITRTAFSPATEPGGTATAAVTATADVPGGSYAVTVTATDAGGTATSSTFTIRVTTVLAVGEVQGSTGRSPLAPPSGNGTSSTVYDVRGVITQRTLNRTEAGENQYGFFLQSREGAEDADPASSDGIFVYMGRFTSLIGGYVPQVGDEVVIRARVSEYFNLTELSSASLVRVLATGLDVNGDVVVTDAVPPAELAAAERFWERHEGMRMRVRAGSVATSGRDVFASTADAEAWLVDRDDPVLDRPDPYARRVFRDAHPLDGVPDGNGQRIMLGSMGLKWVAQDSTTLLPPVRLFDTLTGDAVGGLYFSFEKYGIQAEQVAFALKTLAGADSDKLHRRGVDPSANHPPAPANRGRELAVATFNVENLYDYRDDPFDGCDFAGNTGCPGVDPPFDYVPASEAGYSEHLGALAGQIVDDLHSPDLILVQEAEDQDICTVSGSTLACGTTDDADGAPDTLQELALAVAARGGGTYRAAYDRDGADDRGITSAFLYRTDRLSLAAPAADDPVLGSSPTVAYRAPGLAYNADVQNPKALNADLPSDVDTSTGVDGSDVYTRAPQVARFHVASAPGSTEGYTLWAVSNHFSSTPDARVGQRREQAAYGAAIAAAIGDARLVYGGDLNVFPRPDDPLSPPSDQLGPLYDAGLRNLWENLAADAPAAAYSYVFQGQGQTLDSMFVNDPLYGDLVQIRTAHVNAGWPAEHDGDGARGASDHDPSVARFSSRAALSVADASVVEGDRGTTPLRFPVTVSRPLSKDVVICAAAVGATATAGSDFEPLVSCQKLRAGATSVTFTVNVRGDRRREPDEKLHLAVAGGPWLTVSDPTATGTIIDDD